MYLDTDAFAISSLETLRNYDFTISFDNVINPDKNAPKRMCNGVMMSSPGSKFLNLWASTYNTFDPNSWDHHSSIIPYNLAMDYPDLVHVEMSRMSPISYGFQTSHAAAFITCGILMPNQKAIHYPRWNKDTNSFTFEGTTPDNFLFKNFKNKLGINILFIILYYSNYLYF
jgi:hypothetical protein